MMLSDTPRNPHIYSPDDPTNGSDLTTKHLPPIVFVFMWLQVTVTVFGNVLTFFAFLRNAAIRRKPSNIYILNLALADAKVSFRSETRKHE